MAKGNCNHPFGKEMCPSCNKVFCPNCQVDGYDNLSFGAGAGCPNCQGSTGKFDQVKLAAAVENAQQAS